MLRKLENLFATPIPFDLLELDDLMVHPYPYEQGMVKAICNGGTDDLYSVSDYVRASDKRPVKVEGMERRNAQMWNYCQQLAAQFEHHGPVSAHLFLSPKSSISFPMHTDPDDVIVYMVSGCKVFESPAGRFELTTGEALYIPRGTEHRAHNIDNSVMLSFGLEQFTDAKL